MLNPRIELAVTFAFIVAILFGLILTGRIDLAFSSDLETFSGPRAYPGLILSILLALNLVMAANQVRSIIRERGQNIDHEPLLDKRALWSAALLVLLFVFVLLFQRLGITLTMVPLLTLVALLCGARSPIRAFVVAVCLTALCIVIFRYGLATVLPEGVLGIDMVL